jgi:metallo-beta-lactamase family protein
MSAPRTLTFFGGAATATGSMIQLEAAGASVLLDAGLFQGNLAQAEEKNRELPLDPTKVDAILLSQAGLAYAGRAPQLVRHGYAGPVFSTPGTREMASIILPEAALELEKLQDKGTPLYGLPDALCTQSRFVGQPYLRTHHLRRNLTFTFHDAGHVLGSASIELRTGEGGSHRIIYSACVGRPGSSLFSNPRTEPGEVDTLIIGSPYAHASHPTFAEAGQQLAKVIADVVERGGQLIVPAAALGPAQELIRTVQELRHRNLIPEIPIFLDTPTPVSLATMLRLTPETLADPVRAYASPDGPFDESLIVNVTDAAARTALDSRPGPAIIIAPSETGDSGRSAHHIRRCLGDTRHTIMLISFQEEGSLGRMLLDDAERVVIDGETIERQAAVEAMPAFSGYADGEEMRAWLRSLGGPIKRAFVVHGDDLSVAMMVTILREEGVRDVIVPRRGESFPF